MLLDRLGWIILRNSVVNFRWSSSGMVLIDGSGSSAQNLSVVARLRDACGESSKDQLTAGPSWFDFTSLEQLTKGGRLPSEALVPVCRSIPAELGYQNHYRRLTC